LHHTLFAGQQQHLQDGSCSCLKSASWFWQLPRNLGIIEAVLRKTFFVYWSALQVRLQMQQVLLDRTAHEPIHSVRRGLADVIAATARQSVPAGQWPDLLTFLHQCSQADSAEHNEVALLLFGRLFETVGRCAQSGGSRLVPAQPSIQQ
jgi:hypothetical protein